MMLEVGYEFKRKNKTYCLLDIIDLDSKKYALFSIETPYEKLNFEFCEITEDAANYNFKEVTDTNITNLLFEQLERSNYGGQ